MNKVLGLVVASIFSISINADTMGAPVITGVGDKKPVPITRSTKWYPGHYQTLKGLGTTGSPPTWQRPHFVQALNHPKNNGFMLRIWWKDLETERGKYDFSQIDAVLNAVGAKNKHLILNIVDRSFSNEPNGNMPAYVPSLGCAFSMKQQKTPDPNDYKGLALKWYKPECVDMFIDLYKALGKKYDSDKRLWAVTVGAGESALGAGPKVTPDYTSQELHQANLIRAAKEVKEAFPTTLVLTGCNYPPVAKQADPIAEALKGFGGSGLSHPDTVPGTEFPCTSTEIKYNKQLAIVPQTQTSQISPTMPEAERKIFDWAINHIGAHAIIWGDGYAGPGNYVLVRVLPFLSSSYSTIPAANLTCPSSLGKCLTE